MSKTATVAIIIVLAVSMQTSMAQVSFTPVNDVEFTVYSDGSTHVSYVIDADPTKSEISTGIFGDTIENVVVQDENGLLLENDISGSKMTIKTLGASKVSIDYDAHDLIKKDGKTWHFEVDSPVRISVTMPTNAVIVGMDTIPLNLQSVGQQSKLTLPAGSTKITYVFGITGSAKTAKTAIKEAQQSINSINEQGIETPSAIDKLQEAQQAFDNGKYKTSAKLASEAEEIALQEEQNVLPKENTFDPSSLVVGTVVSGATAVAVSMMIYKKRRLKKSLQGTLSPDERKKSGDEEQVNTSTTTPTSYPQETEASQENHPSSHEKEKSAKEKIFELKPELRQEDKDVVSFIFDKGGSALESELRKKFLVPRTTMWRAVKRLEREGIVQIEKRDQQNLVSLREDITDDYSQKE